jgi:hypothetical protein
MQDDFRRNMGGIPEFQKNAERNDVLSALEEK